MRNAINLENLFIEDIRNLYIFEMFTKECLDKILVNVKYDKLNYLIKVYKDETEVAKKKLEKIGNLRDFSLKNGTDSVFLKLIEENLNQIENEQDLIIKHIRIISLIEKLINNKLAVYRLVSVYSSILGFEIPVRLIEEIIEEKVKIFCEFLYMTEEMRNYLRSSEIKI